MAKDIRQRKAKHKLHFLKNAIEALPEVVSSKIILHSKTRLIIKVDLIDNPIKYIMETNHPNVYTDISRMKVSDYLKYVEKIALKHEKTKYIRNKQIVSSIAKTLRYLELYGWTIRSEDNTIFIMFV